MPRRSNYSLGDFRELTKDLPDDTDIILSDPDTGWPMHPGVIYDADDGIIISGNYGDCIPADKS